MLAVAWTNYPLWSKASFSWHCRLKQPAYKVQDEPARPIPWGDRTLLQPAQWKVEFHTPQYSWSAEYWVGNHFVSVKRREVNALGFLMRLHKGVGMDKGWILGYC